MVKYKTEKRIRQPQETFKKMIEVQQFLLPLQVGSMFLLSSNLKLKKNIIWKKVTQKEARHMVE